MVTGRNILHGVVRSGLIVPDKDVSLPDGARVEIALLPDDLSEMPVEFQTECAAWDRAGADAWALMEEWERDDARTTESPA